MHYDGVNFTVMETGTDIDLTDVWGTSETDVWACGVTRDTGGAIIIHYDGLNSSTFYEPEPDPYFFPDSTKISGPLVSIWTDSPKYVWLYTNFGIYKINAKDVTDYTWNGETFKHPKWPTKIRGNHSKDIFACGAYTTIWHYNGISVHYYSEVNIFGKFLALAVKGNLAVVVGYLYDYSSAIAVIGRRN